MACDGDRENRRRNRLHDQDRPRPADRGRPGDQPSRRHDQAGRSGEARLRQRLSAGHRQRSSRRAGISAALAMRRAWSTTRRGRTSGPTPAPWCAARLEASRCAKMGRSASRPPRPAPSSSARATFPAWQVTHNGAHRWSRCSIAFDAEPGRSGWPTRPVRCRPRSAGVSAARHRPGGLHDLDAAGARAPAQAALA